MADKSSMDQLGRYIKMLSILTDKNLNNHLNASGIGLTSNQVAVIMTLYEKQNEEVTQKQIESLLRLSHPTTRGIIKRLASSRFIKTTFSSGDRRQVVLSLTKLGKDLFEKNMDRIQAQLDAVESQLTSGINAQELALFQKTLFKMIQNMQS
ncbi:MarR family transcriptional regulator [Lentilactobacillus otakiensis]|nr:MarR family transcriptional regulator [Lentilactobacillus otakiensis]MBZ3776891.1 MarR family transcriptional regulator [Lentilactobacillus otakiensis]MDV3517073.1 MarR family transcriptional regulator [Lentilactobacillus otakiensis]